MRRASSLTNAKISIIGIADGSIIATIIRVQIARKTIRLPNDDPAAACCHGHIFDSSTHGSAGAKRMIQG